MASRAAAMGDVLFLVLRRLRAPLITLVVVYAVSIAGLVLIPGVDAEGHPWRMGFFHAFYVMSYTATTIGFGEIPYAFTDAQRIWTLVTIYLSVIGWAYALGAVFALSQDPTFRAAAARAVFLRRVARLREPYCVICGYGRSGRAIAHALDELGVRTVIVEHDALRAAPIAVEEFATPPLLLVADARQPEVLRDAGIAKPECRAVLALTGDAEANQSIAIGTRVLDPATVVIARVSDAVARTNLEDFGGVRVIDPFETFATNLGVDFSVPEVLQLEEWLTGVPGALRPASLRLPHGHWVIAGYGRFGRSMAAALRAAGQGWAAVDPRPPAAAQVTEEVAADLDAGRLHIDGNAEHGLRDCGIENAVGLIAATDNDTLNLATVTMARRLNPSLAVIVRQNKAFNRALIEAAGATLAYVQSDVMTHEVLQALTSPLLNRFLALSRQEGGALARHAVERLEAVVGDRVPHVWTFECDPAQPGMQQALAQAGEPPRLRDLLLDPRDPAVPLQALPLLLWRPPADLETKAIDSLATPATPGYEELTLPEPDVELRAGDRLLFAGGPGVESLQRRFLLDPSPVYYVRTGVEPPRAWIFRKLMRPRAPRR